MNDPNQRDGLSTDEPNVAVPDAGEPNNAESKAPETLKIKEAEFIISAVKPEQYPVDNLPEVAMAGRSNVGKSSMINKLCNRRHLARTSSTPGKTQTLNFYQINKAYYIVDLPGYGYASVSKTLRAGWGPMMENYLRNRPQLRGVIQLVDIRHPPSKDDMAMYEWLTHFQIATAVIATKSDKISRGQHGKHVKVIRQTLNVPKEVPILTFSSETGEGKEDVLDLLGYLWGTEILEAHL
ncbi:YihA family ribosome biogenesis GTP-binding protein [Heliobacillus mobilis]|uniref:Probable GTP-binding protein EngB n=1 Tax=Heliobacterium mobile TaxID=28064 RepID=A0A6I3SIP2_HELMO|nr:ribosome biogenesis GTP-binding protein YihA/YsxC [Heliobacterium mobile]MTV48676.1 YihA family ribosome biogenesis GTP-binding protein [Heliobacterium mobile]